MGNTTRGKGLIDNEEYGYGLIDGEKKLRTYICD